MISLIVLTSPLLFGCLVVEFACFLFASYAAYRNLQELKAAHKENLRLEARLTMAESIVMRAMNDPNIASTVLDTLIGDWISYQVITQKPSKQ